MKSRGLRNRRTVKKIFSFAVLLCLVITGVTNVSHLQAQSMEVASYQSDFVLGSAFNEETSCDNSQERSLLTEPEDNDEVLLEDEADGAEEEVVGIEIEAIQGIAPFTAMVVPPGTPTVNVSSWAQLSSQIASASGSVHIVLTASFTSTGNAITIPAGLHVYLSGGHSINQHTVNQRHFVVNGGTLSLGNVTLTRADASSPIVSGGVHVGNNGSLNMHAGSVISNNRAVNGGGVYVVDATFTMHAGTITGNEASDNGGGVVLGTGFDFNMSAVAIISGNTADNGGGIGMRWGTIGVLNLTSGIIESNTATNNGGGISIPGDNTSPVTLGGNIIIRENTAQLGGGISGYGATGGGTLLTISGNALIENNTAIQSGGGVRTSGRTITITGSPMIYGNTAYTTGGGIAIINTPGINTLVGGTIENNQSSSNGGGISVHNSVFTMTGGLVAKNTSVQNGGGLASGSGSTININGGTMYYNQAGHGGAIRMAGGGILNVGNSAHIDKNRSSGSGGGISATSAVVNISGNASFTRNRAEAGGGGAILVTEGSILTMTGGTIGGSLPHGNTSYSIGGGISSSAGAFVMESGNISYNVAGNFGGGGINASGELTITGGTIQNNRTDNNGAGIRIAGDTTATISNAIVSGNNANLSGGGFHIINTSEVAFANVTITNNHALGGSGGGVNIANTAIVELISGNLTLNTAFNHGGGVNAGGEEFIMVDGSIQNNEAGNNGGGVNVSNSNFTMAGGLVENNEATNNGGGVRVVNGTFNMNSGRIDNNWARPPINPYGTGGHMNGHGGGGISATDAVVSLNNDARITNNRTTGSGGGILAIRSGVTINMNTNGMIDGNETTSVRFSRGGGVNVIGQSTLEIINGRISNNRSLVGAGLRVDLSDAIIRNVIIEDNHGLTAADHDSNAGYTPLSSSGGGIALDSSTLLMITGTIRNNSAGDGGGVRVGRGTFTATDGSIINNHATRDGGGIWTIEHDYNRLLTLPTAYSNLNINPAVIFSGNTAGNGSYEPPVNWADATWVRGNGVSPSIPTHQVHQLNNYDVNFRSFSGGYNLLKISPTGTRLPDAVFYISTNPANAYAAIFLTTTGMELPHGTAVYPAGLNAGNPVIFVMAISGADGIASFTGLPLITTPETTTTSPRNFYVVEKSSPVGYELSGAPFQIVVTLASYRETSLVYGEPSNVENLPIAQLPYTGGGGMLMLLVVALGAMLLAGVAVFIQWERTRRSRVRFKCNNSVREILIKK